MTSAAAFVDPAGPPDARAALQDVPEGFLARTDPEVQRLLFAEEDWVADALAHRTDADRRARLREEVRAFARAFPPP